MNTFNQQNNGQAVERELSWNDTITADSAPIVQLDPGYYVFKVAKFERGRSNPTEKLPACNMAKITLDIYPLLGGNKLKSLPFNLTLHSTYEWKISQFFVGIGLKQKGAPLVMDWNNVLGQGGVCEIDKREWKGNMYDNVKQILDPEQRDKVLNEARANAQQMQQMQTPQTVQMQQTQNNEYPW